MSLSVSVATGWFAFIISCYYVIRPLPYRWLRAILTLPACILLVHISCQNLVPLLGSSIYIIAGCWLISIRLVHLTVFSEDPSLAFRYFVFKVLWIFFPILPKHSAKNQWPIIYHLILLVMKLLINHWTYRWSIRCPAHISGEQVFIFFLSMITFSYIIDAETVVLRILTRDKYTLESFTDFPLFSRSLREFWGQRYNRYVNTVLKESVFQPIRMKYLSRTMGGLATFIVSGLLHAHLAYIVFDDVSSVFPAFIFFILHGIACCFEAKMKFDLPGHVGWVITTAFLICTAPMMIEPFIREPKFLMLNPPPLLDVEWIPKLPVPSFCPQ